MNVSEHEHYMRLCLDLALKGQGIVSPNPVVGCVAVKDDRIISTGFHGENGLFHAERVALMKDADFSGATLYVNLQPCCHFGKTPPCTDIIIEKKISRVIYGVEDPDRRSVIESDEKMKSNGIEIISGILRKESIIINRSFFINQYYKRPFVFGKWGQTIDGKIADHDFRSKFITSEDSRKHSHILRFNSDAVLVGINTVMKDNPRLDIRIDRNKELKRVILDPNLRIDMDCNIVKTAFSQPVFIFCKKQSDNNKISKLESSDVKVFELEIFDLSEVMRILYEDLKVNILMVEGGGKTLGKLFDNDLIDELNVYIAPLVSGDRQSVMCIERDDKIDIDKFQRFVLNDLTVLGDDIYINYFGEKIKCLLD